MTRLTTAVLAVAMLVCPAARAADEPTPGNIKLANGYTHEAEQGIDTQVGTIAKKDGPSISYDIGELAGNRAQTVLGDATWSKRQTINGNEVMTVLTKDGTLYVTFPKANANFYGKVKTPQETAEVLLMLLTYQPPK